MSKKVIAGALCVGCLIVILALLALWEAPKIIKVNSVIKIKETLYPEAVLKNQKASIEKPGLIDYVPPESKSVLPFLKTKACVATVKNVETLYKKYSQDNTYLVCNLVELKVKKNIAGGFKKGQSVYVMDPEMALYTEDIGKDGVFIPDRMESEITISDEADKIHSLGSVKESESRIILLSEKKANAEVSNYWKLKRYMKKNNYIE